jgi:hypothetical protein
MLERTSRKRGVVHRALGALFGALVGSLVTGVLVMILALDHWLVLSPMVLGAVIGATGGDRSLLAFMRLVGRVF